MPQFKTEHQKLIWEGDGRKKKKLIWSRKKVTTQPDIHPDEGSSFYAAANKS